MTDKSKNRQALGERLKDIYEMNGKIETSCCRQCSCCRVACPQMKYSEALQIVNKIWNEWSKEEKVVLLKTCIKYFFDKSLVKPCPMLSESVCKVYNDRPLNCRLYGLWPAEVWEKRVASLAERLGLPKENIPLNTQCPFVELKEIECTDCGGIGRHYWASDDELIPDDQLCSTCGGRCTIKKNPFTEKQIQEMFDALDNLDKQILSGGNKASQSLRKAESMVRSNWNYRTIHDWVLFFFWGEDKLSQMTDIAMVANEIQLKELMKAFEDIINSSDFELPPNVT